VPAIALVNGLEPLAIPLVDRLQSDSASFVNRLEPPPIPLFPFADGIEIAVAAPIACRRRVKTGPPAPVEIWTT
jgi:hypothetical protein